MGNSLNNLRGYGKTNEDAYNTLSQAAQFEYFNVIEKPKVKDGSMYIGININKNNDLTRGWFQIEFNEHNGFTMAKFGKSQDSIFKNVLTSEQFDKYIGGNN